MFSIIHSLVVGSLIATNLMLPTGNVEKSIDAFNKVSMVNQVQVAQLDKVGTEIDKMVQSTNKLIELKKLQYLNSKQSERAMLEVEINALLSQIEILERLNSNLESASELDKMVQQTLKARLYSSNILAD